MRRAEEKAKQKKKNKQKNTPESCKFSCHSNASRHESNKYTQNKPTPTLTWCQQVSFQSPGDPIASCPFSHSWRTVFVCAGPQTPANQAAVCPFRGARAYSCLQNKSDCEITTAMLSLATTAPLSAGVLMCVRTETVYASTMRSNFIGQAIMMPCSRLLLWWFVWEDCFSFLPLFLSLFFHRALGR